MALREIGAFWVKEGTRGEYLSCGPLKEDLNLNKEDGGRLMMFPNDKKTAGSNQPDYRLVLKVDDNESE